MNYKTEYIQKKIDNLCYSYKIIALLTAQIIKQNNFKEIVAQHKILNSIYNKVIELVKKFYNADILTNIIEDNCDNLPNELNNIKLISFYNKWLSLKYLDVKTKRKEEQIILYKLSIELNPSEDIAYLKLAQQLKKDKKYPETLKLCEYIKTFSESAPIYKIEGDIYKELKYYSEAIEAYQTYLKLNENDEDGLKTLNKLYEAVIKQ